MRVDRLMGAQPFRNKKRQICGGLSNLQVPMLSLELWWLRANAIAIDAISPRIRVMAMMPEQPARMWSPVLHK